MQIKRIEETVFRFESDWATQNQPPDYKNYFEPSDPVASTLLQELIHTDIEMRWRHGMSIDLGRYTQRHREIANDSTAVAELIWTEWELRRLGDPSITIEDILQRYPNLRRWWKELKDCNESPQKHLPLEDRLLEHEMMKPPPSLPGFKIQEVLGRGGMGIVYKAVDLQLRRDVAIKFVLSGPLASSAEFERFRMEAEIVASFRHPQVLQVYSAGEFQGQPYLVLEYAPNGNLRKRISGQPMPWRDAAEMLHGLALATEAIHQCGFLHRDLKPANVLLTSDGLAKIGDFGLAKRISADAQQTDLHAILGTPSYSAPEYLFSTIDRDKPTIDVYSLGAILYEMITGRPAFAGASFLETLEQIKEGRIINPRGLIPKIPIDLETICLKCLELSPNQRYASAKLLAEDLARFLDGRPVLARPISKATQFLRWARRNPQTAALATLSTASVLLLLIGFLAFTLYQSRNLAVQIKLREDAELASKKAITQERLALQESVAASDAMHLIEELFEVGVLDKINELVDSDQDSSVSELSARQLVETSIQTMANRLQEHPLARARVLRTLAGAAFNLGMITEARKLAEECLSICSQKIVSDTLQRASIQSLLGQIYTEQCEYGEAITLFDEAIGELQKNGMMNDTLWAELCVQRAYTATIWRDPLTVHRVQYDLKKAVSYLEERYSNDHPKNIYARIVKVMSKTRIECKYDVALRELEEIWKSVETATVHPLHKARLMNQIASVHQRLGDTFNATSCADSSLKWLKLAVPDTDHPIAATLHADAAWIAHQRGDPGEAIEYQRLALTGRWKHLGFDSSTQSLFNEFITFLRDTGRINELKHWLLRRHEASTGSLPSYLVFPYHIARVIQMEEEGNYDDALRTLDSFEKQFIDKTSEIQTAFELHRARLEFYRGNIERCRQILQDLATQHSHRLTNTPFVGPRVISPSELYAMTGQSRLIARDVNLSSETLLEDSMLDLPRFHPDNWRLYYQDCIDRASDFSLDTLESWRTGRLACEMPNHICLVSIEIAIAKGWMNAGEFERAVSVCQKVVDKLEKTHGDLPGLKLDASLELALILARGGRTHEAKNLVNEMMELCQQTTGVESIETVRRMRTASQILLVCKENQDANLVAAQATQIALKVRGLFHPEFIRWIENQAVLLYRTLGPEAAQAGVAEHLQVIQARYPTEAGGKRQLENLFSAIQSL